jgi:hypothetical protein
MKFKFSVPMIATADISSTLGQLEISDANR